MKLSEKIIKIRKENGLSQEEFGDKINVSRQAVSKWENEEAKPDTEKIQEIVKVFNVSYEYLLNDKIEKEQENDKVSNKKERKNKIKSFLKVILIIIIIYLLISTYKFITFYRFYTVANSFSEKNYLISQEVYITSSGEKNNIIFYTKKFENKILETAYSRSDIIKDENGKIIPYSITYTDIDKKEAYSLYYNKDEKKYIYNDRKNDMANDEEREELFVDKNNIKETTLENIPSSFKEIFLSSINPTVYYVDIVNKEFRRYSIADRAEVSIKLSKDFLLEKIHIETKFGNSMEMTYSYDYVQDHNKDIENPIETYENKIIYENER